MSHGTPEVQSALEGRYAIQRELGHGGMATVYLAQDLKLHRPVALKVLRPELGATLGPDRFLREIEIAARLSHPHILPLHDSGDAGGHLYYAMPYIEGETLRQKLEREGQLPVADAIAIIKAVAGALAYAHQNGIIHRDIKPENILLGKNSDGSGCHPLVADFGIARAFDKAGGERLTETGLALGTPAYMSPEQAAGGRPDGRADIYALGCVAYEMLAGQPPFVGPTAQSILARHAVDPVPPLHTVRGTVPAAVEAAIERALAKVPADRFATADEFAAALMAGRVPAHPLRLLASRRVAVALSVGAAAAIAAGTLLRGKSQASVVPSATTMAILPFFAAGSDTALNGLGKDLAVTLSASLDGIGEIETADRLLVANATADRRSLSLAEGAALARRLGSSSFVRGTLIPAGQNVRLDLGLYRSDDLAPLAEGITVTGHRDSIGMLTDSTSWALLRQVWQRGQPPSPSLAEVTTRSLPALRAFLHGERELGANRWEKAALAFRSAITADSTFGLAHFRYALTQWWTHQPLEPDLLAALHSHSQRVSGRERLLLDAFLTSTNLRLRIERYQAAAEQYPQYWPAWFLYADALFHSGPVFGYDWADGLKAFRRVLALNPRLVPAWSHVLTLGLGKDHSVVAEAQARLTDLGWRNEPLIFDLFERLDVAISGAGGVTPPHASALADSAAEMTASSDDEMVGLVFGPLGSLQQGYPVAQHDFNRRLLRSSDVSPKVATATRAADAWNWASRGRWDSAITTMNQVAKAHPGPIMGVRPVFAVESYGLAVVAAWLGASPPALADSQRPAAIAVLRQLADSAHRNEIRGRVAWFDGLLAFARGDRRALQAARGAAAGSGHYQADRIERSLAAFESALSGNLKRAGQALAREDALCAEQEACSSFTPHVAIHRLAAAHWLQETGDEETAARLLRWQDANWIGWLWTLTYALAGPAYLTRARIEESRGGDSLAQEYYRQFLRRYDQPMPSQRHLVEEARAALVRLSRETEAVRR
jgi:tetratricopeptide (TPR) repeat protein